jgi:hypothetical protein
MLSYLAEFSYPSQFLLELYFYLYLSRPLLIPFSFFFRTLFKSSIPSVPGSLVPIKSSVTSVAEEIPFMYPSFENHEFQLSFIPSGKETTPPLSLTGNRPLPPEKLFLSHP